MVLLRMEQGGYLPEKLSSPLAAGCFGVRSLIRRPLLSKEWHMGCAARAGEDKKRVKWIIV